MNYYKTIEKRMGLPGLADQLADLSGSDLNTLLMEVFRLQAGKEQPAALVSQLVTNRFTMPATTDPMRLRELEIQYLDSCKNAGFSLVQFGPLAPLGTCSSMAPVSQQTILPALRNTEVVSDVTNLLALLIANLGLLGLASHLITRRRKEIGVRKALGARMTQILAMLSRDLILGVAWAALVAGPVAFFVLDQWLRGFAYRISIGIGVFAFAVTLTFGIAWLTISYLAIRAARANPVDSLRYE